MIATHSPFKALTNAYGKVVALVLMMMFTALLPQSHSLSFLIQYLLMAMLFFAFLDMEIKLSPFQKGVIWIILFESRLNGQLQKELSTIPT